MVSLAPWGPVLAWISLLRPASSLSATHPSLFSLPSSCSAHLSCFASPSSAASSLLSSSSPLVAPSTRRFAIASAPFCGSTWITCLQWPPFSFVCLRVLVVSASALLSRSLLSRSSRPWPPWLLLSRRSLLPPFWTSWLLPLTSFRPLFAPLPAPAAFLAFYGGAPASSQRSLT